MQLELGGIYRHEFKYINSNMFFFFEASSNTAFIIDPHIGCDEEALFECNKVKKCIIILTHEHFDHTNGVNYFKNKYPSIVIAHKNTADKIKEERNNRPLVIAQHLKDLNRDEELKELLKLPPFCVNVDEIFEETYTIDTPKTSIIIVHTPGHSPGSCCIQLNKKYIFTGDSLIPGLKTITNFPNGSLDDFEKQTVPFIQSLDDDIWIMPGHGIPATMGTIRNENKYWR